MAVNFEKRACSRDEVKTMTDHITRPGITQEEVIKTYELWAPQYHQDAQFFTRHGPEYVVKQTVDIFADKNVRLLDACSGTGMMGLELHKAGFCHIDALDGCAPMLEEAKKLNIYGNFYNEFLGPNKLSLADNIYDGIVAINCFGPGHAKDDCFEEIIRILKPGGYFIAVMCERHFSTDPEWTKNFEPHMKDLKEKKQWKKVARKTFDGYTAGETSILYILQKNTINTF